MPLSPRLPLLTLALAAHTLSSCTCESGAIVDPGRSDASSDAGDAGGGPGGGGGSVGGGGGSLDGGCDLADRCGQVCCGAGTQCLFDRCVAPGRVCQAAADCAPDEYCETGLGGDAGAAGDGGFPGDGGMVCTQPVALSGRCLGLPPRCPADAGMGAVDGGCIPHCEYRRDAGTLDAVQKWTWGPVAVTAPDFTDVWSTPTVGRVADSNCDGRTDELDPPNVIFVSGRAIDGNARGTCCQCTGAPQSACHTGVLRVLDGKSGSELWSLTKAEPSSMGFSGVSVAIGDVDGDGRLEIAAVTGEGNVVLIGADGTLKAKSDSVIAGSDASVFGWGGGLSIADMDHDGFPEIAYGSTVFTARNGQLTRRFAGNAGVGGGGLHEALSILVDLDLADGGDLELLAGRTAYRVDGSLLWSRDGGDGFPAVADLNKDGVPEVVVVENGRVTIREAATGARLLGPLTLGGNGFGGPPTIADFDGDGSPEIGVAQADYYSMVKPNFGAGTLRLVWQVRNHDLSSSVTGSSVFDFEGDGRAEVVYADECFLWVYDGPTGAVRFATPHTSFTATEASLVADIDGDGRADILMVSNGADPSADGWKCDIAPWNQPDPVMGRPAWKPPAGATAYRGLALFSDRASAWVGTRTLWNQHSYHVSNICDERDSACSPAGTYGSIPRWEQRNWTVPWLNNFRQNVQDRGLFDAPDLVVSLATECTEPLTARIQLRNIGLASVPPGVPLGVFKKVGASSQRVAIGMSTRRLLPGQTESVDVTIPLGAGTADDEYFAKVLINVTSRTFHQCREDNDESEAKKPICFK